ncbi:MAG: hypothetical protein NTX38_15280 [Methylobacter sp.]|nr:hypothetical protein [Methylobacter sp.]
MKNISIPALLAGTLSLAACADGNYKPYALDDNFGKSAKQLAKAQIANPQAAAHPPANSPRTMDGYAGVNIIRTYRNSFGQNVQPPNVTINVGSGSSGSGSSGSSGSQ